MFSLTDSEIDLAYKTSNPVIPNIKSTKAMLIITEKYDLPELLEAMLTSC